MKPLAHDTLITLLTYDGQTGEFYWNETRGTRKQGDRAGYLKRADGYYRITINRQNYLLHRLAWYYVHGKWPDDQLDHANGDKMDNRIINLRPSNAMLNQHNAKRRVDNTSGKTGVSWCRQTRKWKVAMRVNKQYVHIGYFQDKLDAIMARERAERKYQPYRYVKS